MDELAIALPAEDFFGLGSPQSARESLRARPLDPEKEIPLLFVDDDASTPTAAAAGFGAAAAGFGAALSAVRSQSRGRTAVWAECRSPAVRA